MAKMYAWATIMNGGESETRPDGRKTILSRNIVEPGTEVTAAKLDLSKDEFQALVDNGSVRGYPMPKNMGAGESPAQAIMRKVYRGDGEISQDMLLELALSHPPEGALNPPADQEAELPVGV